MASLEAKPLIVQGDGTLLLEVDKDVNHACRDELLRFSELVRSPEHIHTYRITPLAVWNAASSGVTLDEITSAIRNFSQYEVPQNVLVNIRDWYQRYGRLKLVRTHEGMEPGSSGGIPDLIYLESEDERTIDEIMSRKSTSVFVNRRVSQNCLEIRSIYRGRLKQSLIKIGYPVEDLVGYVPGDSIDFSLRRETVGGRPFSLRKYQQEAVESFTGGKLGGTGIIVLPSGAGKTIVGMGVMNSIRESTLIITTGTVAVRQWINELYDKTNLLPGMIGEYTGESKEILPVTVTTYQVLTYSPRKPRKDGHPQADLSTDPEDNLSENDEPVERTYPHLEIFRSRNWGLIIYDEVHLLPAPVFRITTEIQAKKRLGLTATLIREDGKEEDVFSLIGPKRYDAPWKDLEKQGWIATAQCYEVRVNFPDERMMMDYAVAPARNKYRIAAENPNKVIAVRSILSRRNDDDSVLIIGDFLDQLTRISEDLNAPLITGKTPNSVREDLYSRFRRGDIKTLVVSKVANYAIDLPDANVAIQISGTFGSRQEEAQRLGRILRPKSTGAMASFYSVVTKDTVDQEFSMRRQLFLTERGYRYTIIDHDELIQNLSLGKEDDP